MIKEFLIAAIKFYRSYISIIKPPCCRFTPTCSEYAQDAVIKHGALKGAYLALLRILRCHPFNKGGYDPVP